MPPGGRTPRRSGRDWASHTSSCLIGTPGDSERPASRYDRHRETRILMETYTAPCRGGYVAPIPAAESSHGGAGR
ncbi:hypothetical protein GCM10010129_73320 [Streptomyces fumigatiscleroticus]|nr:hypothetical protein GCM10010129_73320 [Streptomyces fumigatiscleroticus]